METFYSQGFLFILIAITCFFYFINISVKGKVQRQNENTQETVIWLKKNGKITNIVLALLTLLYCILYVFATLSHNNFSKDSYNVQHIPDDVFIILNTWIRISLVFTLCHIVTSLLLKVIKLRNSIVLELFKFLVIIFDISACGFLIFIFFISTVPVG